MRHRFPALANSALIYLDSAATTLKPESVVTAFTDALRTPLGNPGRSLHQPALQALAAYSEAHEKIAEFGGVSTAETVLLGGATEALVHLAHAIAPSLSNQDEILVGETEHHSNLLPWLEIAERQQCAVRTIPVSLDSRVLDCTALASLVSPRTKVVAVSLVSNVLGTLLPLEELTTIVRKLAPEALIVLDACQAAAHYDLRPFVALADFTVISSHKVYAPSGVGVIWSHRERLQILPSLRPGGGSIQGFSSNGPEWKEIPHRHAGGTPNTEALISFAAALDFLSTHAPATSRHHHALQLSASYRQQLAGITGVTLLVPESIPSTLTSFAVSGVHAHDIAEALASDSIAVRAGHHCASPLHLALNHPTGSVRVSFGIYSTQSELDAFMRSLSQALQTLNG